MNERTMQVQELYTQCVKKGNEDPYQTAQAINAALGGITRVDYDPNRNLCRLYNHDCNVSLNPRGLNKKQAQRLNELVLITYSIAKQNQEGYDRGNASEVRIELRGGRKASTKHHRQGFQRCLEDVMAKYDA